MSNNDNLYAKLKYADSYDVIVVGAGPAGIIAALSAARNGAKTLIIERMGFLGGAMTFGTMAGGGINGYTFNDIPSEGSPHQNSLKPFCVRGISLELYNRMYKDKVVLDKRPGIRIQTDTMLLIHTLDEMLLEAGVDVLFNSHVFDAVVEDGVVKGVAVANKSGGRVYLAAVVIDASADGDVAASSGADYSFGRWDGRVHGISLELVVGGIDVRKFVNFMKSQPILPEKERNALELDRVRLLGGGFPPNFSVTWDGKINVINPKGSIIDWEKIEKLLDSDEEFPKLVVESSGGGPYPGSVPMENGKYKPRPAGLAQMWIEYIKEGKVPMRPNTALPVYEHPRFVGLAVLRNGKNRIGQMQTGTYEVFVDNTNAVEVSEAMVYMRKVNMTYFNFLRERVPGFEDIYILNESPTAGTRESRSILGEYTLTDEDVLFNRTFDDAIAVGGPRGPSTHTMTGLFGDGMSCKIEEPFQIPYRIMIPKGLDNIITAGRCVSCTYSAFGAIRDMASCMSLGEAAGVAAALASKKGVAPRNLDIKEVQKTLTKQGALWAIEDVQLYLDEDA